MEKFPEKVSAMTVQEPDDDPQEQQLQLEGIGRLQRVTLSLAALFGGATLAAYALAAVFPNVLFVGVAAFLYWCFIVSAIQYYFFRFKSADRRFSVRPSFAPRWQWGILAMGIFFSSLRITLAGGKPLSTEELTVVRLATVIYLAAGCLLYFVANFANAVQRRIGVKALSPVLVLTRMAFGFCLAAAGITFLYLSTARDFSALLGWPLIFLTLILAMEPFVRLGARFYQPKESQDTALRPICNSLLLDAAFGQGDDLRGAVRRFETLSGMRLSDMWMVRFLRQTVGIIVLGALLLGWLSTSFTAVPVSCQGVRVLFGRYDIELLQPGLHVTLPWPFEYIAIVETERVRSVSLGFDTILDGPVLWNEPHVQGEKNLLVGDGEALLTVNVPILYRINNPLAYLRTSSDPEQGLASLAERKLLHIMGSRDSFSLMIEDRAQIARTLHNELQKELDSLNLGIELIFVGLQDIHPPVSVAPAYQEVVSAQEEKEAAIDEAKASRASTLPGARAEAMRLTAQATADYAVLISKAKGSTAHFLALAAEDKSELLRTRLRFEALEVGLTTPAKIILGIPSNSPRQFYLDFRNTGEISPP
jgi:HflK protein